MHPVLLDSSFLIALERELERGVAGPAIAWLRRERGRHQRALIVSSVSLAEVMEGTEDGEATKRFLSRFVSQPLGAKQAAKCADLQRKAGRKGTRHGENDAWQLAVAECAGASIVGRDTRAFAQLGSRYEEFG